MRIETFLDDLDIEKDNAMFLNAIYHYPNKYNDWTDMIEIVHKNIDTNEKMVDSILNPEMVIFALRDGVPIPEINEEYMNFEDVVAFPVRYKDRELDIAKRLGEQYENKIYENMRTRNRRANRQIHNHPTIYGSDYDIQAWTKIQWALAFENDRPKPITKQYLDIEVDVVGLNRFVEPGERPINAVTIVDEETMSCHTFLLRNEKNPLIEEFEKDIESFVDELHEEFDDTYGVLEYKIYMYDEVDEINLINDIFRLINTMKRDFLMIWNMDFDIPYILERINILGHDPLDIIPHRDFERPQAKYVMNPHIYDVANRSSRFDASSYTTYLDQMVVYAGLRKGQGAIGSTALTAIGQKELDDDKLDFGEATNFGDFPYTDYKLFVKYNIKDVLLQMGIERKTLDIEKFYSRVSGSATPYDKAFKQTRFVENRAYIEFHKQGKIIGNNTNINYSLAFGEEDGDSKDSKKYDGGLVADPTLNAKNGLMLYGERSKYAHKDVIDFDYKSMYPNIYVAYNISKSTLIGKLVILTDGNNSDIFDNQDLSIISNGNVDGGTQFLDDYITDNISMIGNRWFNLPTFDEVISKVEKKFELK